jgi:hypothetical protein
MTPSYQPLVLHQAPYLATPTAEILYLSTTQSSRAQVSLAVALEAMHPKIPFEKSPLQSKLGNGTTEIGRKERRWRLGMPHYLRRK